MLKLVAEYGQTAVDSARCALLGVKGIHWCCSLRETGNVIEYEFDNCVHFNIMRSMCEDVSLDCSNTDRELPQEPQQPPC